MSKNIQGLPSSGISLGDIVYVLFKHKWKILATTLLAIAGAAVYYWRVGPVYESQAKLMVRYIVEESAVDDIDSKIATSGGHVTDSVIKGETEILTSWDLAYQTAGQVTGRAPAKEDSTKGSAGTKSLKADPLKPDPKQNVASSDGATKQGENKETTDSKDAPNAAPAGSSAAGAGTAASPPGEAGKKNEAVASSAPPSGKTAGAADTASGAAKSAEDPAAKRLDLISLDRLVPPSFGPATLESAAAVISQGLTVTAERGSSVINVAFKHSDPGVPRIVLDTLVKLYLKKHIAIHRNNEASEEVQILLDDARADLTTEERRLNNLKSGDNSVLSLPDAPSSLNSQMAKLQEDLNSAQIEEQECIARLGEFKKALAATKEEVRTGEKGKTATPGTKESATAPPKAGSEISPVTPPAKSTGTSSPEAPVPALSPVVAGNNVDPLKAAAGTTPVSEPGAGASPKGQNDQAGADTAGSTDQSLLKDAAVDSKTTAEYQEVLANIGQLRLQKISQMTKFPSGSGMLKSTESQIDKLEDEKAAMEKKHPSLIASSPSVTPQGPGLAAYISAEQSRLATIMAKKKAINDAITAVNSKVGEYARLAGSIAEAQRKKDIAESKFKYLNTRADKSAIDIAVTDKGIPNISKVQEASPAATNFKQRNQIMLGMVAGGPVLSIVLVLVIGLFLNRNIRRATDLEDSMGVPVMLSIPFFSKRRLLKARRPMGPARTTKLLEESEEAKAPWEQFHFIHPFAQALRDRLSASFEADGNFRKPKLIGVTGCSSGAGITTLAAGLASSLSEIGEGKVLLVDMNGANGAAHPFFDGRPALSLSKALRAGKTGNGNGNGNGTGNGATDKNGYLNGEPVPGAGSDSVESSNLLLARADVTSRGVSSVGIRRMMPELKASDFDYVVFDMPPLGQTRPTAAVAGLMDKVLVIVESEANSRSEVRRGYRELADAGADVAMIFNKARSHGPKALVGHIS